MFLLQIKCLHLKKYLCWFEIIKFFILHILININMQANIIKSYVKR